MTRLTNEIRKDIARDCVEKQFRPRADKLKKEEHTLGMKCYREVFDAKTRAAAAKMPKNWMRMDGCLRFNCGGYDLTLTVNENVPVPYSTHCTRLGNVTGDLATECQDYAQRKEKLREEHRDALNRLTAMLNSVGTLKSLEKTWPEGRPFYSKYLETKEGAALPAVQIEDLNKLLGLKATQ